MNEPVVRYSPEGAVLLTCELSTHQAVVITLASQAALDAREKNQTLIYVCEELIFSYLPVTNSH